MAEPDSLTMRYVIEFAGYKAVVKDSGKTVAFAPHMAKFWKNGGVMR